MPHLRLALAFCFFVLCCTTVRADEIADELDALQTPAMTDEAPAPGRRVRQVAREYQDTDVHHTLYLPIDWMPHRTYPVIVEYTGNRFPTSNSSGRVEDANLGYGLSGGTGFIWVCMPCVDVDHQQNAVMWWGDKQATIDYCKTNLPRVCAEFGGDPERVILCGFSRGAIATSYIGLADDQIAGLWKGILTHDHFDGERTWSYEDSQRSAALDRLARLKGRRVLICDQRPDALAPHFLRDYLHLAQFDFLEVPTQEIFDIPEGRVIHPHTDLWMHKDAHIADRHVRG